MQLIVDDRDLELLLKNKKYFIGKKWQWEIVFSFASGLLSALTGNYEGNILNIDGIYFNVGFCLITVISFICAVVDYFKNNEAYSYNEVKLMEDIKKLEKPVHNHSLVCIKNNDKYLVYDDHTWKCFLFPNYKDVDNDNEFNVKTSIANDLGISVEGFKLLNIGSNTSSKLSQRTKDVTTYHHTLYLLEFNKPQAFFDLEDFTASNGKHYYWMSANEMLSKDTIREINGDIIAFVESTLTNYYK